MTTESRFLTVPYGGYLRPPAPAAAAELTPREARAPAGELLRRYWQPIALSGELGELPVSLRAFGEDLVAFRTTEGTVGLLDRHCSHRGSSLEFGIPTDRGIRCCYHGWLFGVDGRILETPGEPATSKLRHRLCHPAYPTHEYRGLVFGYFGPPDAIPEFPVYDSYARPGETLIPYYLTYPCNWLQVLENVMDPAHAVFLHTRISFTQFADAWGELPEMDFVETPTGMIYVTSRRWNDRVWVRSNDIILPNLAQVGNIWEDGQEPKEFCRVGITRWTVPVDDTTCRIIGWRHFGPEVDPRGIGRREDCGPEKVDFFGQSGERPYDERQRLPGDFDAQVSQRPIAIHALEHLAGTDAGVMLLRKLLRKQIRALARGVAPRVSPLRTKGAIPTYCHDTVLRVPPAQGRDDAGLVARIGREITKIVVEGTHHGRDDRVEQIRRRIRDLARACGEGAARRVSDPNGAGE